MTKNVVFVFSTNKKQNILILNIADSYLQRRKKLVKMAFFETLTKLSHKHDL